MAWAVVLILLALAFVFYRDTVNQVLEGVRNLEVSKVSLCCLFAVVYYLCEGTILYKMGKLINPGYRWYNGFSVSYKCEFIRVLTMGTGAGVAEILFLQKDGIPAGKGTGLTLMQYALKRITMMVIALAAFIFLCTKPVSGKVMSDYRLLILGALTFSIVVSLVVSALAFSKKLNVLMNLLLDKLCQKFVTKKGLFEKWRETMNQLNEAGLLYIHYPVLLIQILILNTVKMLSFYAIPGFILMNSTGFIEGTLLMAVAFVSATIIPSPSGVGALEFAFVSFFGAFVQQADAITSVLVYRFATWIMPCIIGMILFVVDGFRLKRGKNA